MTTTSARTGILLVLFALAGCNGAVSRRPTDDAAEIDAAVDPGMDAGTAEMDAFVDPTVDAFVDPTVDAWRAPDVGHDAYAGPDANWGTCTTGGMTGTCEPMSECTASGRVPVMGLCPGPAEIQCCPPPAHDAGPGSDAGAITPGQVTASLGACTRIGGDYAKDVGGTANIPICQTGTVVWWTADFDVDCDGGTGAVCRADPDYMPDTSAVDSHGNPLDASTLPFIVIPLASTRWRYADYGIQTGQVALVMYNGAMAFGIFGDAGPASIIGEGSYAMAQALGIPPSPSTGGVDSGVTYLVFTGPSGRVTHNESHAEAVAIGQALLNAFVTP